MDAKPSAEYPDRPDHPDMQKLSDTAIWFDQTAEMLSVDDMAEEIGFDPDSVAYHARDRVTFGVKRFIETDDDTEMVMIAVAAGGWCDAFYMGYYLGKRETNGK